MNIYEIHDIASRLRSNRYVGRGIVLGITPDRKFAVSAYFIMGRSENSRNRIFVKEGTTVRTEPYDPSRVADPSLIIYRAVRQDGDRLIVTNGDQTDTVFDGMRKGQSFSEALASRRFEPDAPNLTPRISGIFYLGTPAHYEMSILKSIDAQGSDCCRYTFAYPGTAGLGHFLHTYVSDDTPIPTFQGEPIRVTIPADIDTLTQTLWENLDAENKISLYVRYTELATGQYTDRILNKNVTEREDGRT